jgi:cephalosporin hydroxylase
MNKQEINLNSDTYHVFTSMLQLMMQYVSDNNNIILDRQNNWHDSHPYYRIHFYKNIQVSQAMGIYLMFNKYFLSKFDTIIEIGTYNGGLSTWLFDNKKEGAKFVTYDIDIKVRSKHLNKEIDARIEDCFSETTFNDIVNMIETGGRCLVLCDGGDKPKEFIEFSKYLKSGDHIMCHDYCKNENGHNLATTFWQWPYHIDTFYNMIETSVIENGISPYNHDTWEFFLWGSYIKV